MAWSAIRKATDTDSERLEAAAQRFADRHGIDVLDDAGALFAVEMALTPGTGCSQDDEDRARYLMRLWRPIVRRALGCNADGIAYGYVGNHAE